MKVIVNYSNIEPPLRQSIESHIQSRWGEFTVSPETSNLPIRKHPNPPALLIISADANTPAEESAPVKETIVIRNASAMQEILYQVDVKLGRLTKSDLASTKLRTSPKPTVTRREFLLGFASGFPRENEDLPIVSADLCEARFGCTKCVDVCPAPGALKIENNLATVSGEYCIRCGLCASVCPVAAIQNPKFSEDAFRGLLTALDSASAPLKTLVFTCNERSIVTEPWMVVEEVPGLGSIGVRHLALLAESSAGAVILYCPDGLCPGKENAKRALSLISSLAGDSGPVFAHLEGEAAADQIVKIHESARARDASRKLTNNPWKDYVSSIKSLSKERTQAAGLGVTDMIVSDSCTLCNACVDSCPHKAIEINNGALMFHTEECTGCSYCQQICPERSITLSEAKGIISLSSRIVYKDHMVLCDRCKAPYVSEKMLAKISQMVGNEAVLRLCASCKQNEIYDRILGSSSQHERVQP